jgi:hypothetical protein
MEFIYVRCTIPELCEGLRTSISKVPMTKRTPEATLETIRRAAYRRGLDATYELATREQYQAQSVERVREAAAAVLGVEMDDKIARRLASAVCDCGWKPEGFQFHKADCALNRALSGAKKID